MAGPLSISIGTNAIKTAFPVIADKTMARFKFTDLTQKTTDKGDVLQFKWELQEPVPSTEGTPIEPGKLGSVFIENVQLYDKNTDPNNPEIPEWAKKKIAVRMDALLGTDDADNKKGRPARPEFNGETLALMLGKEVLATMKVSNFEGVDRNEFGKLDHPDYVKA